MPKVTLKAKDKPTIFLSANNIGEDWRFTEIIVAIIESYLQNQENVYTVSSTKIRDVARDFEELDIAFSTVSDLTDYFSFVEVRDRSAKVGRNYVQEIIGKRSTLPIGECIIVSTSEFSRNAKRLAVHKDVNIPLRLLHSDREQKPWYTSNSMQFHNNLWRIKKCVAQIEVNNQYYDFYTEGDEVLKKKFLIPTNEAGIFITAPISKIFEMELLQRPETDEQLFGHIPIDDRFHDIQPPPIFFESPSIYLRTDKYLEIHAESPIIPIKALRFFIEVNKQAIKGKVTKRYQYIDATNEEVLARLVLAEFEIDNCIYYLCLVRCRCDGRNCQIGGVFFNWENATLE